jgi:hypothetical protein
VLLPHGREYKTHTNTIDTISFGAVKLDSVFLFYSFVYIDLLTGNVI